MSTSPKLLRTFYKGSEQRIKVYDGTPESSIINTIKKSFHITNESSKIYLLDDEGDIVVIPPSIPDGLCVYVYIEPSLIPTLPVQSSPSFFSRIFSFFWPNNPQPHDESNILPGFRWETKEQYNKPCITNDGYTLSNKSSENCYPWFAESTTSYDNGKLFVKLAVKLTIFQAVGIIPSSFRGDQTDLLNNRSFPQMYTERIIRNRVLDRTYIIGIFIDIDNKIVKFCHIDNDEIFEIETNEIPETPIKIFGWTKENEMTIMDGGSSIIPSIFLN